MYICITEIPSRKFRDRNYVTNNIQQKQNYAAKSELRKTMGTDSMKDNQKDNSLKDKTAKGLFWGGLSNGVQQLLGLLFGIILARLLSPTDYGMIAMIAVFSLIANELQNSGFRAALVNIKEPTHKDYNSVFWFNILMGGALYAILFFCAPLIANYYNTPELTPLSRYAFLGFVFSSFGTAQMAFLHKNLLAKQMAKAGMTAVVVSSGVGVIMAWSGCSYWSLATQTNLYILINTLLMWHYSSWRPSFDFDFGPVRRMFRFSCKLLMSTILNCINNNILNILLGKYYTVQAAGYYNQAHQWNTKCFYLLQGMMLQVSQPVMVNVGDDKERRLRVLRKLVRFTSFISFPLLLGFGMVSNEFIIIAITEKWQESAVLLQILCVSGAFMPIVTVLNNTILSRGRSDMYMWCTAILGVLQIILMILLADYGIRTMVITYTALAVMWVFVWHGCVNRLIGYSLFMFLRDTMPFAISAAAVMSLTFVLTEAITNLYLLLFVRFITAAMLYFLIMKTAKVKILDECIDFIRKRKKQ